jgi:hypothetical protein
MNFRNDLMNQEGRNTDDGNPSQAAPKDKGSESNHSDTNDAYQLLKMSGESANCLGKNDNPRGGGNGVATTGRISWVLDLGFKLRLRTVRSLCTYSRMKRKLRRRKSWPDFIAPRREGSLS